MTWCDLNGLFRSCAQDLLRFLTRRVACRETAADIAQDAFERMLRAQPVLQSRDGRAYLFRTAANLAIDHGRRIRALPTSELAADELAALPDPAPSPEAAALSRQELRRLAAAVEALPPRAREVFLMSRVDGLGFVEIGRRLGISPKTAFSHLAHALAVLRERLANTGEEGGR